MPFSTNVNFFSEEVGKSSLLMSSEWIASSLKINKLLQAVRTELSNREKTGK